MFDYGGRRGEWMFVFYILEMENIGYEENKWYFGIGKIKGEMKKGGVWDLIWG